MLSPSELLEKLELSLKENEISSWQSDLYVKKNEITTKLINEYEFKSIVKTFVDNISSDVWYDIPFLLLDRNYKKIGA